MQGVRTRRPIGQEREGAQGGSGEINDGSGRSARKGDKGARREGNYEIKMRGDEIRACQNGAAQQASRRFG